MTHAIPGPADFEDEPTGGVAIGEYKNCHYLASGTSADVYRSGGYALKVARSAVGPPPHNARREAQILRALQEPCVPLVATFSDAEQRLVLVLPFMPLTLDALLYGKQSKSAGSVSRTRLKLIFTDLFRGLVQLHSQGIIHRDVKPSSVLLASADGPAYLSDFGTAWHPALSRDDEPADHMVLDIGTGPYRAPETLFGNQAYGPAVDLWAAGCMLAECARQPPTPLFESRAVHEDGNQLGLILSIFKTLGTPTRASWPEAEKFKTPPFEMYRVFEPQPWTTILPDVDADVRGIIEGLVRFDSTTRLTAEEVSARRLSSTGSVSLTVHRLSLQ